MENDLKPGDDVYWWCDFDPGDPEVGPQPCIAPVYGRFVDMFGDMLVVDLGEGRTERVNPRWLLTDDEVRDHKRDVETFCAGDQPWTE